MLHSDQEEVKRYDMKYKKQNFRNVYQTEKGLVTCKGNESEIQFMSQSYFSSIWFERQLMKMCKNSMGNFLQRNTQFCCSSAIISSQLIFLSLK